MKVGVIGSGKIGQAVGGLWATAGHDVLFASRHPVRCAMRRDWRQPLGYGNDLLCRTIGNVLFASKAGSGTPKYLIVNDDIDIDWGTTMPASRASFARNYPKELQDRVLARWTTYGFRAAEPTAAEGSLGRLAWFRKSESIGSGRTSPFLEQS